MSGSRRIGNYLISDYLGGGGFGSVFKAQDGSGRIVAIKELHVAARADQTCRARAAAVITDSLARCHGRA